MWSRSAISRRGRLLTATFGAAYLPRYRRLGWWRLIAGINQGLANAVGGLILWKSRVAVGREEVVGRSQRTVESWSLV
jgi:hypothetical protein